MNDVPPKKDGANSMWAKDTEVPRLISLRRAAHAALEGKPPLKSNVALHLDMYCRPEELLRIGDLDNFVTGICDGLMRANPRIKQHARWQSEDLAPIRPEITVALVDDSAVVSIKASKRPSEDGRVWYAVELTGDP